MRILIVEDSEDVAAAITAALGRAGMACDRAAGAREAQDYLAAETYDVVVLDIHLPDGDGRTILSDLRRAGSRTPVLMLTAELEVSSRVNALDAGADDYLVKPFDLRELEARVRVLGRRGDSAGSARISVGDLEFDQAARTVRIAGAAVALTRREVSLLGLLVARRDRIIAKEQILERLFSMDEDVGLNTVELYVARLRKKLAASSVSIVTHRGLGYQLTAPDG
ncbi:two-component system, regulatory protein [Oceanicola granulosus HTCC2516]|uniref:Two-component system, regulatory protein n=1 Tax=Oceanicola granulosus (strain ATCC BAA-861 / DSM 15982 / KCTC 12143 / HTCC2516) TaxID=314256 RepID=Q2CF25_OCEGH|nr:response regulator transcription factor [Oceanicola granulosus]EAR51302.1 two-component system, regulatory protein [Oceanicola granulosus HTCC2516]